MNNEEKTSSNPTRIVKDPNELGLTLIAGDDSTGDTIREMSEAEIEQTLKAMLEALRGHDDKENP